MFNPHNLFLRLTILPILCPWGNQGHAQAEPEWSSSPTPDNWCKDKVLRIILRGFGAQTLESSFQPFSGHSLASLTSSFVNVKIFQEAFWSSK